MLTTDEINAMKATIAAAFPETGTLKRSTLSSDNAGGFSNVLSTVATIDCRLDPPGQSRMSDVSRFAEKIGERSVFIANVPAGTDIRELDILVVDAIEYDIAAIFPDSWGVSLQALAIRHE